MKNFEKYKTAEERIRAFEKYHEEGCSHCETCPSQNVRCFGSKTAKGYMCYQSWLDLEVEEEKLLDCPFCRQAADALEREENYVKRYEYAEKRNDGRVVHIHDDKIEDVTMLYDDSTIARREVGEWEEVK